MIAAIILRTITETFALNIVSMKCGCKYLFEKVIVAIIIFVYPENTAPAEDLSQSPPPKTPRVGTVPTPTRSACSPRRGKLC